MRLAIIDCGTNTFNLLVVEIEGRDYSKIFHSRIPVKLGERAVNNGIIADPAFRRGIEAFDSFCSRISELNVNKVIALATSAIRDGGNGAAFVQAVRDRFGVIIEVIDGEREADLIYLAVKEAVRLGNEISLIMDIGGGSVEFLLVNSGRVFWKHSFNLGAARLLERFAPSDPITSLEISNIEAYLWDALGPLVAAVKEHPPAELVGSSGAFESFVEMMKGEFGSEGLVNGQTEYEIAPVSYSNLAAKVIGSTVEERRRFRGLVPMRVDMIVICCIMVSLVMRRFALPRMRISTYSLKEGAMVDFINRNTTHG